MRFSTGTKVNGILNEPEVFRVDIDGTIDFVMIGSDGVWDPLKEQFALNHRKLLLQRIPDSVGANDDEVHGVVDGHPKYLGFTQDPINFRTSAVAHSSKGSRDGHVLLMIPFTFVLRTTAKPEDLQNAGKASKADNAAVVVVVFKYPEPIQKRAAVQRIPLSQLQEPTA